MKSSRIFIAIVAAIALWAGGAPRGSACSVPVFRYALELWPPDHFPLYLLHRGEPGDSDRELIDRLRSAAGPNGINLRLVPADVEGELDPEPLALWEALERPDLDRPLLVLRTPTRLGPPATVLTLELSPENVGRLLGSPAREEIARRILDDHSVVWVLLEGGRADRDDAAFETLTAQLDRLEGILELPDPAADDLLSADVEPLKLAFSALRLRRDDPDERAFVATLLNVEPDLIAPEFDGQPMVFPVFGRGRALYALVGDGIVPATIEDAARYLTGACQCTVKAENPGADLLMAVDWDRWVTPTVEPGTILPPLGGLAGFAEPAPDPGPSSLRPSNGTPDAPAPIERGADVASSPEDPSPPVGPSESRSLPVPSPGSDGGARPGLSALLIVSAMGIMVLLAGIVLTRRSS